LILRRDLIHPECRGHISLNEGCFDLEEGVYFIRSGGHTFAVRGVHFDLEEGVILSLYIAVLYLILWVWHIFAHAQIRYLALRPAQLAAGN
jgi:hypothetical protein